ncbi:MAG: hypothetical protein ACI8ZM_003421 [Crocinitomix sp.]|jgi:hypothetical protein
MYIDFRKIISLLLIVSSSLSFGQSLGFNNEWVSIGPNNSPVNPKFRGDAGIGPIEFIRVYQQKAGYLLAGSLHGGLFFSENGGDSWINSGSDAWSYTGCAWADFYPNDENVWFACSNEKGDNGKPGKIGEYGGLMRSKNRGEDWETIGGYKDLAGFPQLKIYGTRFHPNKANLIIVITSEGLYYSEDCMADYVKWKRVPNVQGWVYDLDFLDGQMYLTNFFKGNWNILQFDQDDFSTFKKVKSISAETRSMRNLTIEPQNNRLLVAKDFVKGQDEVCVLDLQKDSVRVLLGNQRIGFGSGHTFAVSPHQPDDFYFGYSTKVRKWSPPYKRTGTVGSGYHVDVEFIAFDPFDSLKLYFATHGGVFISENGGIDWKNKSDNLGVAEVMGMAVSAQDANQIAIGCYHDGSMVYADFDRNGTYYWRTVNGGDGLIPLIDPLDQAVVYTSNQFVGGGLSFSSDTSKKVKRNLHSLNNIKSAGWENAAVLDPFNSRTVYFNFVAKSGINKGNINVCRTKKPLERKSVEIVSDFNLSHQLKSYKVYGLFNSKYHTNVLIAYVLEYTKDAKGNKKTNHHLFRTDKLNGTPEEIIASWYEIKHPNNTWIGDVAIDGDNKNQIYMTYTRGKQNPESIFGDKGIVYMLRYSDNKRHGLKREIDITKNIPNAPGGRYNLIYNKSHGGILVIGTTTGVYYGDGRVLRGKSRWNEIGKGLPHCKVYGLDYNEKDRVVTIGLFGRGVWQYQLK